MRLINLTPHEIVVRDPKNPGDIAFPPSGQVARLLTAERDAKPLEAVRGGYDPAVGREHKILVGALPVADVGVGRIDGLPDPEPGVTFVVSMPVAQAASDAGRADVLAPGVLIRDDQGRPVACNGLRRYAPRGPNRDVASACDRIAELLRHTGSEHYRPPSGVQLQAYVERGDLPAIWPEQAE